MRRSGSVISNALVGASTLGTLLAGASAINPDIRTQLASMMGGDGQFGAMASRALGSAYTFVRGAGGYMPDDPSLVGFGLVAVVLAVLMFRT